VDSSVRVIREVHAQRVVDGALVLWVSVGQDGDDVLEPVDECLDLGPGELAGGRLPAEFSLETLALPLDLGDPGRDDGDVRVPFEELPVASELGVALLS
jgi:hypothetical protein